MIIAATVCGGGSRIDESAARVEWVSYDVRMSEEDGDRDLLMGPQLDLTLMI